MNNKSPHLGQSPFLFTSFYENNGKRGEKGNLDKFGQFRASLGNLGQVRTRQQFRKMGGKGRKNKKRKQQMGKGNENLSGDGEEGGGESRV